MTSSSQTTEFLDLIGKVLLRSAIMGFLLLLLWGGLYVLVPGPIYAQAEWFGFSRHETNLIHYCGMGLVKMCVLIFFLFPYLAIRLVRAKTG
jgi:hypothetical protein